MSIQAVGWALAQDIAPSSAKFVLVAIANYADEQGRCWPSQQRLAKDTSLTERSIRSAIGALEELGVLKRVERRRQDGSRAADMIQIVAFGSSNEQPENISGGLENASNQPENASATTGNIFRTNRKSTTDQPENISGLTTFEPSRNHQDTSDARKTASDDPVVKLKIGITKAFSDAGSQNLNPDTHRAETWIAQGYDPSLILATIREVLARKPHISALKYFDNAISDAHAAKPAAIAKPISLETEWRNKLEHWSRRKEWPGGWGDPPGHPCCKIPAAFIAAFTPSTPTRRSEAA